MNSGTAPPSCSPAHSRLTFEYNAQSHLPVLISSLGKEAEKNGVYAWSFKGLEVGTAYFNVTFSDIDPAKGAPTKKWAYQLIIKVREGAPAGGKFSPAPPPRRPPGPPPVRE